MSEEGNNKAKIPFNMTNKVLALNGILMNGIKVSSSQSLSLSLSLMVSGRSKVELVTLTVVKGLAKTNEQMFSGKTNTNKRYTH